MKIRIIFILEIFAIIICLSAILFNLTYNPVHTRITDIKYVQVNPKNVLDFNYSVIEMKIIGETMSYFKINDFFNYTIIYTDLSVWASEFDPEHNVIYMGTKESDNETYKMVFTHEYTHYIMAKLYKYVNSDLNEGLTDTFTWFTNKDFNARHWGEKDERRLYPYTIIMRPILEKNDFDCLNLVFNKTLIISIEDYEERLKINCNVTYEKQ